ncbi:MAG: OmpA family protein [Pyrinomonadaceae bacterium]|nr:OmpA family protein [Pyrinomonadaceae bacterium]
MKNLKTFRIVLLLSIISLVSVSLFAQVDVSRQTTAVTYPEDELVYLQFRGTTRFPRMKGEAKVKRTKKNGTEIDLSISKMPRPFELGAGYATYVLWAISPTGQIDNLGEIKRRGFFEFDSKISVTTPLQTFALIITAEPHFLVRRPSRAVMLENLNPYAKSGRTLATTAAVQYFGNSSDYFSDARTPEIAEVDYSKTPSTILQARQAVALAKFAGAQRDATDELKEAEDLLTQAVSEWEAKRPDEAVDITARRAISAAVKAESTAAVRKEAREKRNEKTRADAEIRDQEMKFVDAQNQIDELRQELARETRSRELAERDAQNNLEQIRVLREENARLRTESEQAKLKLAKIEGENLALQRQQEAANRMARLQANESVLMDSLSRFGSVAKNERGIVLTLPENYWSGPRVSSFSEATEPKLASLVEVLSNSTDYKVIVESHTDNSGSPETLQTLTQERAQAIADRLVAFGASQDRIEAKGFGASLPVAPNSTNSNRAKNRRILVTLVPNLPTNLSSNLSN